MRTPDPDLIVNLIHSVVGAEYLATLAGKFGPLADVGEIYKELDDTLNGWLKQQPSTTLADIIEYSATEVPIGKPPLIRRMSFGSTVDEAGTEEISESFPWHEGRQLLEIIACSTLVIIITDMLNQEFYRSEDAERRGRAQQP